MAIRVGIATPRYPLKLRATVSEQDSLQPTGSASCYMVAGFVAPVHATWLLRWRNVARLGPRPGRPARGGEQLSRGGPHLAPSESVGDSSARSLLLIPLMRKNHA